MRVFLSIIAKSFRAGVATFRAEYRNRNCDFAALAAILTHSDTDHDSDLVMSLDEVARFADDKGLEYKTVGDLHKIMQKYDINYTPVRTIRGLPENESD